MITVDARIRVRHSNQYGDKFFNKTGTVVRISGSSYGVLIDGRTNPASSYGCFWFKIHQLEQVGAIGININYEEEENMLENMLENEVKCIRVTLANTGGSYNQPVAVYEDVEKGDMVVIQTGHHGYAVAVVEGYIENAIATCGREVVCKISLDEYKERKERRKKLAELSRSMNKRVKELQSFAVFEMLAEKDDTLKEMLDEFKALKAGN